MVDSSSFEALIESPVIPVIVLSEVQSAIPLAEVLINNGLTVIEITLRTEVAIPAIRMISDAFLKAIVGAGTVSTPEQILLVRDSGASLSFHLEPVKKCMRQLIALLCPSYLELQLLQRY